MEHKSYAVWEGGLKDGKGKLSTTSKVLFEAPYSFKSRFEGAEQTNPEELIAAAHAGCFSMALSKILEESGSIAERISTSAVVTLAAKDGGFSITTVHLDVTGTVPGATAESFLEAANKAKAGCPVSKVLNAEITMEARLG